MKEIWKDVSGYKGSYQVSNQGRVRSLTRFLRGQGRGLPRLLKGRILKAKAQSNSGYYFLQLCKNGGTKMHYVHIMVAVAFIPNPESKPEVNHKDTDKTNNKASNLEWMTHEENAVHAAVNGARAVQRFTRNEVRNIRKRLQSGERQIDVARDLGTTKNTINNINTRKTWCI